MSINLNGSTNNTQAFSLAGLTGLSGAATTYSTAALTLQYAIKGLTYAKAQVSGGTTPTTEATTAAAFTPLLANQACCFVWGFDASGTVKVAQGKIFPWSDTSAKSVATPFGNIPDTLCPFAYVVIKNGSTGSSWVFGTGNWNATGIVIDTPVNISMLPSAVPETA